MPKRAVYHQRMSSADGLVRRADRLAMLVLDGLEPRVAHVQGVGSLAEAVARSRPVKEEVVAAAWLHDIGYAPMLVKTGFHPLDGAAYLRETGWPTEVCSLVAYHTGAAWEAEERGLLHPLNRVEPPPQQDLDNLNLFDLSVGPTGLLVRPDDRLGEILRRYHSSDPVHRAVTRSSPKLQESAARALRALDVSYADLNELLAIPSSSSRH